MTGREIKTKREALGLSQKELAAIIGVGKNTIYNYENGGKIPDSKLGVLENALNPNNVTKDLIKEQVKVIPLGDSEIKEKEIPSYIVENEDRLMGDQTFRLWITTKIQEGVIKILGGK